MDNSEELSEWVIKDFTKQIPTNEGGENTTEEELCVETQLVKLTLIK